MEKEQESAFPIPASNRTQGLTKLEYFTAAALTGLCAAPKYCSNEDLARQALAIALTTLRILEEK